ncbi:helix-turn-helix domain-containing protein [Nocardia asteroides]|uniref:helix-turn-helix domain-containing protein n=1 Tax=Nocardia asteroides TaxID=1824 RepID=UPI003B3A6F0C
MRRTLTLTVTRPVEFISTGEFARLAGVSTTTVRRWIADGRGPRPVKFGHHWRFPADEVAEFMQRGRETAADTH